ncbi:MAG: HAD-IC family P-type ATPase [Acidobacteria bacterium]|nr:HAD-IC family P-type ATPase [Acidobacteriota bacterium]
MKTSEVERRRPDGFAWHAAEKQEVFERLQTSTDGLTEAEAKARLEKFGKNVLPVKEPPSLAEIILHQFKSPLIYILLAAAAVAVALRDFTDAGFIMAVVLLNAGLGTFQEWRAEQSAAGLQKLLKVVTRVRREGVERRIEADDLAPGDVVLLESGNRVPADLRLLQVNNLSIDESFLTGESLAVEKNTDRLSADITVAERLNLAFAGSTVMSGRGAGVAIATGLQTEVGKIAETVTAAGTTKPPLVIRMEQFAHQISYVVLGACGLLAMVALAKGMPVLDVFFLAVALAVSAIPEGLPVAMTVALSIATNRMAKRNVIVRKLTAVEGLGSCTFIASDKTGTLTVNRQTVRVIALPSGEIFHASGEGYAGEGAVTDQSGGAAPEDAKARLERLVKAGVICNEASLVREQGEWKHNGDAVDVALLALGYKMQLDPAAVRGGVKVVGEIPFESERSYAATFYEEEGRVRVAVKGALEVLAPLCRSMLTAEGAVQLDEDFVERQSLGMSESGHRFIAIAEGELAAVQDPGEEDLPPLTLLGLVGLIDPPRAEAGEAVRKCRNAGIEVAMVTGDHPLTAFAIARELGIAESRDAIVTGRELEKLGDPESASFRRAVESARVFARVAPMQKLHIVEALRASGHFVAVTGDGVNDAPALKKASISVAMGSGSDVTKDTASLIVTDDNFASIEAGVEEGRFAYDNIRKVTYLLISTGAAEVLLFVLSLTFGLPLPLLPVQILWLNLVTNGIQDVALAFEGGEPGTMNRPPRRPGEGIFNRLMIQQTLVAGLTMGLLAFANWWALLDTGMSEFDARDRLLLLFVLMQNFHAFNCRSEYDSVFRVPLSRNYVLAFGVLAATGLHILAMHTPVMQRILQVAPIRFDEWLIPFAMASVMLAAMEIFKFVRRKLR